MIKNRIIATLVIKEGIVIQSLGFSKYLPVGKPEVAVEFLNQWGIDEIILVDIDKTKQQQGPDIEMIKRIAKKCFVPLTVGGGITNIDQMRTLIRSGADKIAINTAAIKDQTLITKAAQVLGNQCVIVSIDVKKNEQGQYDIYTESGRTKATLNFQEYLKMVQNNGAGEILLNSIDQDGAKQGYDVELIKLAVETVSIPVIALGGAGHPEHFLQAFATGNAAAVAAANFFHFTEHSPILLKAWLKQNSSLPIRLETYATYDHTNFDQQGRLQKNSDEYLQKIRFEYKPKEII